MDESVTRRGQPCWYKKRGVGLLAINDSFILEAVVYRMLRKHFRGDACYVRLLELFLDVSHKTELGQVRMGARRAGGGRGHVRGEGQGPSFCYSTRSTFVPHVSPHAAFASVLPILPLLLYLICAPCSPYPSPLGPFHCLPPTTPQTTSPTPFSLLPLVQMADMLAEQSMDLRQGGEDAEGEDKQAPVMNLDLFTADRHAMIVKYKTAFYTFYLPVALGMVVSGMDDDASYEAVQQICVHMGEYFQVRRA